MELIGNNKKSTRLTPQELRALKKWIAKFGTKGDAAKEIGIGRNTLHVICKDGSGSPESIEKIVNILNPQEA